ncbi:SpoIIE family protein phosphatase [Streptomyces sp. NPDC000987]|uniref:ATP-binding SpoIIE family protein phosphatase n=1 Tax=Streptomyces sp. NPDC000987 TaxID=3154374 RepID=UPI003320E090
MGVEEQHPRRDNPEVTPIEEVRLELLAAAGEDLSHPEILELALAQAVAELGGLGGLARLSEDAGHGVPRVVAGVGLTGPLLAEEEGATGEAAEFTPRGACDVRVRAARWPGPGRRAAAAPPESVPPRATPPEAPAWASSEQRGIVSVPLLTADGLTGSLSVLTPAFGGLDDAQYAFLARVANWIRAHLRLAHTTASGRPEDRRDDTRTVPRPPGPDENIVRSALWEMSDGFLAVDRQARITFANAAARRLLGRPEEVMGTVLWDLPVIRGTGMATRYREAEAAQAPVGFDTDWPGTPRWYHVRLAPVPDGFTAHITDITERREREVERSAAARAAAQRVTRMGELTSALAEALTVQDVVKAVADRMLPPFGATGLLCQLIEDGRPRIVGSAGYPEAFLDTVRKIPFSQMSAVVQVLTTRSPIFLRNPKEYAERHPDAIGYLYESGKRAWAFLPLIASDQQIGYCVVSFSQPRQFSQEDRSLLIALSGLVAQALERARLYDAEHTRAQELQRGLLPRTLPLLPAVTAAAHYLPAGEGMQVGGDWYDLIPLSGERVALVIGDVMGHGLSEAATMGRLRTAVHTLADLELPPDELLTHLNDLVGDLGDDFYATCLYSTYDPTTGVCTFANAGHPPPALVRPDGTVRFLDVSPDPPLGAAFPPFETHEIQIPAGSLLVLYTDGLVESSTVDINEGMVLLSRALAEAAKPGADRPRQALTTAGTESLRDLDRLCDALVTALLPEQMATQDDAALLIARTHCLDPERIASWSLPDNPIAAGEARHHVTDQLAAWQLEELSMTTELLVSELVGNVVRHAKGPIQLRLLRGRNLICEVSDGSLTTPRIRRAAETDEGGRGLQLVAAMSHRWGTRFTPTGKCIWTEQALPPR